MTLKQLKELFKQSKYIKGIAPRTRIMMPTGREREVKSRDNIASKTSISALCTSYGDGYGLKIWHGKTDVFSCYDLSIEQLHFLIEHSSIKDFVFTPEK